MSDDILPTIDHVIEELVSIAADTKKRVFNKIKLKLSHPDPDMPKCIYITLSAEPSVFGGSIFLGEDILIKREDYFTTSVIEQCKQLEGYDEPGTLQ